MWSPPWRRIVSPLLHTVYIVLSIYNFGLSIGSSLLENCAIEEHANKLMIRMGRVEGFLHKLQCPKKYNNFLLLFCEVFSMIFCFNYVPESTIVTVLSDCSFHNILFRIFHFRHIVYWKKLGKRNQSRQKGLKMKIKF